MATGTVVVTEELIQRGAYGPAGWNKAQVRLLGLSWPLRQGWKQRVIGRTISAADAERFLALRGQSKTAKRRGGGGHPKCHHCQEAARKVQEATGKLNAVIEAMEAYLDIVDVGGPYDVAMREALAKALGREPAYLVPPGS